MVAVLVSALFSVAGLFLYPQTYSATVSISMQQPNQSAAALLGLTGNSGTKKYIGVIKSRLFAEKVDKQVHFRELMNLSDTPKHQNEAIERVMKDLKAEDNTSDGLLYVTVNVTGAARFAPDPGNAGQRRNKAVALAANLYAKALKVYLRDTDTDKDAALRRSADLEVAKAQNAYDRSIAGLAAYIRQTRILMVPTGGATGGASSTTDAVGGGTQVASLYGRRAQLEATMKSSEAVTADTKRMVSKPDEQLTAMPDEDPLLFAARREVNDAANRLHTLQITFGSSMQSVRRAQETSQSGGGPAARTGPVHPQREHLGASEAGGHAVGVADAGSPNPHRRRKLPVQPQHNDGDRHPAKRRDAQARDTEGDPHQVC